MSLLSEKLTRIDNAVSKIKENFDMDPNTVIEEVAERASKYKPTYLTFKGYTGTSLDNDLRQIDTSNLKKLSSLFMDCTKLTSIDATNLVKSNITSISGMFDDCNSVTSINITGWDCSNVTDVAGMFCRCRVIPEGFSELKFGKLTNISSMFSSCSALQSSSQLPDMDVSECTDFTNVFYASTNVKDFDKIKDWNVTSKLTDMLQTFMDCWSVPEIDISKWDTSNVYRFYQTFNGCRAMHTLSAFDGSAATSISYAFHNCSNLQNFGGIINLGKAYSTRSNENYYTLDLTPCSKLTETSLISILNNLYDIKTKGCKNQKIKIGATNLAKLTSTAGVAALENAAAKGWNVE